VAQTCSAVTKQTADMLRGQTGLAFSVAAAASRADVKLETLEPEQVVAQNIGFETAERSAGAKYPSVYVYCEKLSNLQTEKFRTFSGKAKMVVDVRVSQDRLEEIQRRLELYAEAVTDVLDAHRGNWGAGMFYGGGYEVTFNAIRHGGKNFMQTAKVTFDVDISLG